MKSIKPGRGSSMMSAIIGIFVALFGVFWTIAAVSMGAGFMGIFGLIFVAVAIVNVVYNFRNATSKNRYSSFDITEDGEELDPWNERFGERKEYPEKENLSSDSKYCPYCGAGVQGDFEFCNQCGKRLP